MQSEGEIAFLVKMTPCDPYMTFDPKLVMSQVRVHALVIVTKQACKKQVKREAPCQEILWFGGKK